jgi:nitroreductase
MDTFEAIYSRKSIRSYTGEPITEAQLAEILKAANASPVGMGRYDSLHLTVVRNAELLEEIDNVAGESHKHLLYGAPLLIIVSSSTQGNVSSANVGIVIHNMALAAVALGIGHCDIYGAIHELVKKPELVSRLQLPEGFVPLGALALGLSKEGYKLRDIPARIGQNELL